MSQAVQQVPGPNPSGPPQNQEGLFERRYYLGLPGLLKLGEAVLSIIAFIVIRAPWIYCYSLTSYHFFLFVTMSAFILSILQWGMYLLRCYKMCPQSGLYSCALVEIVVLGLVIFFYFFGNLFVTLYMCTNPYRAAAAFGWMASILFCIDLVSTVLHAVKERRSQAQLTVRSF